MTLSSHRATLRTVRHPAFTLVEMLVALAILTMIVLMAYSVMNMLMMSIGRSSEAMEAEQISRTVFDRLGMDLESRLTAGALGNRFEKAAGNDSIGFFAQVRSVGGTRGVSWLEYLTDAKGNLFRLTNQADALKNHFGDPAVTGALPPQSSAPNPNAELPLAEGVLRFEFFFLLHDGTATSQLDSPRDLKDKVAGLVVGLVVAEPKAMLKLNETQIGSLRDGSTVADINPASGVNEIPSLAKLWQKDIENLIQAESMPLAALQGLRAFERIYRFAPEYD